MEDLDRLVLDIEQLADGDAREKARAAVRGVIAFHREAIARWIDALGPRAVEAALADDAVAGMLLLHGLHPVDPLTRAHQALERIAPQLQRTGASAELLPSEDGALRVSVRGPAGAAILLEETLCAAAPDVQVNVERVPEASVERLLPAERLLARPRAANAEGETCEMCAAPLGPRHGHLVEPTSRQLRCACEACAGLFSATGDTKWKRLHPRAELLEGFLLSDDAWGSLGIPIDLAFFYRSSPAGRVVAFYPGPAGATESLLSLDAWARIEAENPRMRDLEADVEALLVRRGHGAPECYRVSIDECYALVGHIRRHWRGLSGGAEAWEHIGRFFEGLRGTREVARA